MAGPAKLSPEAWDDLRGDYEGGQSVKALSDAYGISRQAIMKRAAKDAWDRVAQFHRVVDEVDARAHSKAAGVDVDIQAGQIEMASEGRQALIQRHRGEWSHMIEAKAMMGRAFDPNWAPEGIRPADWSATERAKFYAFMGKANHTAATAILVSQEGERRAHGFDYRIQQKSADGSTDATQRRRELLERLDESLAKISSRVIEGTATEVG